MSSSKSKDIIFYHEETKHHIHRFARSSGFMDWKNQPDPFRTYKGVPYVELPLLKEDPPADYIDLYKREKRKPADFTVENIGGFLELSMGLSAWKSIPGSRWSLRMNPSSGNLHAEETHLVLPPVNLIKGGVYHYNPFLHSLEQRTELTGELWDKIKNHFKTEGFLVALSTIYWREAWKYGERAFRYCNHDTGHAMAALSFSANLFGWKIKYLNTLSTEDIEKILGFDRTGWKKLEEEEGEILCYLYGNEIEDIPRNLPEEIIEEFGKLEFVGEPNELSRENIEWNIIYKTAALTRKEKTEEKKIDYPGRKFYDRAGSKLKASQIIRQRRSGVDFDRVSSSVTKEQFFAILDKTLPGKNSPPFDIELIEPSVHLFLFVHNVKGLKEGMYFFIRNMQHLEELKRLCHPEFLWKEVEGGFPIYLLIEGNVRNEAKLLSCTQDIAGDSAFSLGMVAKFREIIEKEPYSYSHLFREAGMIGQVLYLEAEAYGVRGTGIGCFFDDPVHEIIGLTDNSYQSLYHFTIGKAIEDERLETLPPYFYLEEYRGRNIRSLQE